MVPEFYIQQNISFKSRGGKDRSRNPRRLCCRQTCSHRNTGGSFWGKSGNYTRGKSGTLGKKEERKNKGNNDYLARKTLLLNSLQRVRALTAKKIGLSGGIFSVCGCDTFRNCGIKGARALVVHRLVSSTPSGKTLVLHQRQSLRGTHTQNVILSKPQ